MMEEILVLGYFGYRTNQLDGQTIKTRNIYNLLAKNNKSKVDYFDTQDFKFNKLSVLILIKKLILSKKIVYLPAHGNLKYIFPFLYLISKVVGLKIYYFVIGGWLPEYLDGKKFHLRLLKKITGIFTETILMKNQLHELYGFENVNVFKNFRFKSQIENHRSIIKSDYSSNLKLVFLSRINKKKGLESVFLLAEYIILNHLESAIKIDFFGPVFKADEEYFYASVKKYSFIKYGGVIGQNEINKTLSEYDALLFPTEYYTEGLPGAIIDAYMAGIPVIASNWKHAYEFIRPNETGMVFEWGNTNEFIKCILKIFEPNLLNYMKSKAFQEKNVYLEDTAWKKLECFVVKN